jgi:hypothetical protein
MLFVGVYSSDDWRLIREVSLKSSGGIVGINLMPLASFLADDTFVGKVKPMRITESTCNIKDDW